MEAKLKDISEIQGPQGVLDVDTRDIVKSGYRILKTRGKSAARLRVPAGNLPADALSTIQTVAETYGNGSIHLTTRQGIEIPHIDLRDVPKVKEALAPIIRRLQGPTGTDPSSHWKEGYRNVGTRNIVSCVGNRVCQFANCDSSALAERIEREFFEKASHMKIGITACPNDCARARVMDLGIVGVVEPLHDLYRCVGCSRCANTCKTFCGAIEVVNEKAARDEDKCILCGECVKVCPMHAWKRGKERYHLFVGGRMGKRDPRLGMPLIEFVTEDTVIEIIRRTYKFIERHIDKNVKKEFVGYIIDRVGFEKFKKEVLIGVNDRERPHSTHHLSEDGMALHIHR